MAFYSEIRKINKNRTHLMFATLSYKYVFYFQFEDAWDASADDQFPKM